MHGNLELLFNFSIGLIYALIFSYIAQRLNMSLISGYLIAGYMIGPFSPGFIADIKVAEELAQIGIILMLFGAGLNLQWQDLIRMKKVAIPGAVIQTIVTTTVTTLSLYLMGWTLISGIITGLSIGVSSTVVMLKVLNDMNLMNSWAGHIAIGWTIVEDFITVIILISLPTFAAFSAGADLLDLSVIQSILFMLLKFSLLVAFMLTLGQKGVSFILTKVSQLGSKEMLTLAVLALVLLIATGSAFFFNTSIPFGAFIAGIVIGRTKVKQEAAVNSLPLKDIFSIIFFLAVGMLFDPRAIINHFPLFLVILAVILVAKPTIAFLFTRSVGYSNLVSLTAALAFAQIGEFSFILAEEASLMGVLPDDGYDIIVACALASIIINPLLFRFLPKKT
jgi:CPA2 family monovalent cation:H+ antiporter-2